MSNTLPVISEQWIRAHVSIADALASSRIAFEALGTSDAVMLPPPMQFILPKGETCVKGAWLRNRQVFGMKMASSSGALKGGLITLSLSYIYIHSRGEGEGENDIAYTYTHTM